VTAGEEGQKEEQERQEGQEGQEEEEQRVHIFCPGAGRALVGSDGVNRLQASG
jgi:hypothetical protein